MEIKSMMRGSLFVLTVFVMNQPVIAKKTSFLEECEEVINSALSTEGKSFNAGRCQGLVEGFISLSRYYKFTPELGKPVFCMPGTGTTSYTAVSVVVGYMKKHPEKADLSEHEIVFEALDEAYSCKQPIISNTNHKKLLRMCNDWGKFIKNGPSKDVTPEGERKFNDKFYKFSDAIFAAIKEENDNKKLDTLYDSREVLNKVNNYISRTHVDQLQNNESSYMKNKLSVAAISCASWGSEPIIEMLNKRK